MTVAELKNALEGMNDTAQVVISDNHCREFGAKGTFYMASTNEFQIDVDAEFEHEFYE